jgi:hypothetical protein
MTAQCPLPNAAAPDLASVQLEAEARLAALTPRLPAIFRFDWRGMRVSGRLEAGATAAARGQVRLLADLGAVPYTAEDPARRAAALALDGRRQLRTVNNRLTLAMTEPMEAAASDLRGIVTAITLALIKARPAIDAVQPLVAQAAQERRAN